MPRCTCRFICRCPATTNSQETVRVNNGQQIQEASQQELQYMYAAQNGLNTQNQQGLFFAMAMTTMQNISITQRDTAAAFLILAKTQQAWYRDVTDYRREEQELRRRLAAASASGNVQVDFDESIRNSIGETNVDLLRSAVQAAENEARSSRQQCTDLDKTYWEKFKGLSNLQKGLVLAGLAAIIGVVGWASWTWVVPWAWPKLLVLVEMVKTNAPYYVYQLLNVLFNQAKNFWGSGNLQSSVVNIVNSGYFTAAHYLVPGFGAMIAYAIQPDKDATQN